jgi:hypothetical protein
LRSLKRPKWRPPKLKPAIANDPRTMRCSRQASPRIPRTVRNRSSSRSIPVDVAIPAHEFRLPIHTAGCHGALDSMNAAKPGLRSKS